MTGDQINNAIEAALPMLDEKARKALTFTRWHDGIDIEYPTVGCRGFVAAILLHLTGQLTDGVTEPHPPSRCCACAECCAYFKGEPCTRGVADARHQTVPHQPPIPLNAEHSTEGKEKR